MNRAGWWPAVAFATALHGAIAVAPLTLDPPVTAAPVTTRVQLRPVALAASPVPDRTEPQAPAPAPARPRRVAGAATASPGAPTPEADGVALGPPQTEPTAASAAPALPENGVAGAPPATGDLAAGPPTPPPATDPDALRRYAAEVRARMHSHKRYPRRAARLGLEGVARVRVEIAADGALAGPPRIVARSGVRELDQEAMRMARAAAPYPAPPAGRPSGPLSVEVPVRFRTSHAD